MSETNPFVVQLIHAGYELGRTREISLDSLSPLYNQFDGDVYEDESIFVSIGDIAHTCGSYLSLYFLPETADRRLVLRMIFPSIQRASRHAIDRHVHSAVKMLGRWVAGEDVTDLRQYQQPIQESLRAMPSSFFSYMDIDKIALAAHDRAILAAEAVNRAIDYATHKEAEIENDNRGYYHEVNPSKPAQAYRIAWSLIEQAIDPGEASLSLSEDIIAVSPLYAIKT